MDSCLPSLSNICLLKSTFEIMPAPDARQSGACGHSIMDSRQPRWSEYHISISISISISQVVHTKAYLVSILPEELTSQSIPHVDHSLTAVGPDWDCSHETRWRRRPGAMEAVCSCAIRQGVCTVCVCREALRICAVTRGVLKVKG